MYTCPSTKTYIDLMNFISFSILLCQKKERLNSELSIDPWVNYKKKNLECFPAHFF